MSSVGQPGNIGMSPATWTEISRLLDEAFDLDSATRERWLAGIAHTNPDLAPIVRKLLEADASHQTLGACPWLGGDDGHQPGAIVGPYRLERLLGSGGMADVWLGTRADGTFERRVAIKLPRARLLGHGLDARFARERSILARLEHPRIARLYDAGVSQQGVAYMAMEYVEGSPILEWCDQHARSVDARIALFDQVLDAVQFAHAHLVIHRDLKPSNVLVTNGQVRLLDFGIAQLLDDDGSGNSAVTRMLNAPALTPDYASPEQILGVPLTVATDIYSLGVMLYELVAGARPYHLQFTSIAQLEQAIVQAEPPLASTAVTSDAAQRLGTSTRQLRRALAGDVDTILQKALAKRPEDRYRSAGEFAADLARHRQRLPVHARRTPLPDRMWRFVVRHRLGVAAATVAGVALLAGTGVSVWQARRATEEAQRADAVKRFVVSIFDGADTDNGGNRNTTPVDLLTQARERLRTAEITDPRVNVELLGTIGQALSDLGALKAAEPILADATALAVSALGPNDRLTAITRVEYGRVLLSTEQRTKAKLELEAAQPPLAAAQDQVWLTAVLRHRAMAAASEGRSDDAIALFRDAISVAEQQTGHQDQRVLLAAYRDLANHLLNADRPGSLPLARRAYDISLAIEKERPVLAFSARSVYARALAANGHSEEALGQLEELLGRQRALMGPDSYPVEGTTVNMGVIAFEAGDVKRAIDIFRELVRIQAGRSSGRDTPGLAYAHLNLGTVYANAHRYREASEEWAAADAMYHATRGDDDPQARIARASAALALARLGDLDGAERLVSSVRMEGGLNATAAARLAARVGMVRSLQGRHDEAEALLRDVPDRVKGGATPRQQALALAELGYARVAAHRDAQAREVLQQARDLLVPLQPHGSPDLAEIDINLARSSLGLGRRDDAVEPATRAVDYWSREAPGERDHGIALWWLADALGTDPRADTARRQALAILKGSALPADRALVAADTAH